MFFEKKNDLLIGRFGPLFKNPIIGHGFSTRRGGISRPPYDSLNLGFKTGDAQQNIEENRKRFFQAMGIACEQIAIPEQVHGNQIIRVNNPGNLPATDGLITNNSEIALSIQTADCLPIFLLDPIHSAIGLIHAGWRGTEMNISQKVVTAMSDHFNTKPENLQIFFGPSIGPCCYTIGPDVAEHFSNKYITKGKLNLWECNKDQLIQMGARSDQIILSRLCTVCHPEWFFSHRRSVGRTGRMIAICMLKN